MPSGTLVHNRARKALEAHPSDGGAHAWSANVSACTLPSLATLLDRSPKNSHCITHGGLCAHRLAGRMGIKQQKRESCIEALQRSTARAGRTMTQAWAVTKSARYVRGRRRLARTQARADRALCTCNTPTQAPSWRRVAQPMSGDYLTASILRQLLPSSYERRATTDCH